MVSLISAVRAIVEMLGLCLIGQAVLYLLAGSGRQRNPVYQLFSLLTAPPRRLVAALLPSAAGQRTVGIICFVLLLILWLGLAFIRKFV